MSLNSNQVLQILDEIAAESSKNIKQSLVSKHIADPLFEQVLRYAYDPFMVFGMLPHAGAEADGELYFDEVDSFAFLDKLLKRELTGNAARAAFEQQLGQLHKDSGELLIRILRKDLRAGFSESTINKAKAGLIPVFPYQRCSLPKDAKMSDWPWGRGVISQEKADGMYANGTIKKGESLFLSSRQGTPLPMDAFQEIVNQAKNYLKDDLQYHGELLVERDGKVLPREIGNGILNSVAKGGSFGVGERPIYVIWDFIPVSSVKPKGTFDAPYQSRFKLIVAMLQKADQETFSAIRPIPTRIVHSFDQAHEHYAELLKAGKEGTIVKHPDAIWKDGTSKHQVKLKLEADCELEVLAINEGKTGSKNEGRAGALRCQSQCGNLIVDVAIKNEKMRDNVDANPNDWIGKIVTVRSNQIIKPSASNDKHSLFLPRLVDDHYRSDKTTADCLERVHSQFDNIIRGGK